MSVDVSTTDHVDKLDLNDKKKNFIERMCDDKVSANRGPIRRRTASWLLTKTIKTNSNLNPGLHRVCVAATL